MRTESVRVSTYDGDELDAHLVVPERGAGGRAGIVLLHEGLGLTDYTRAVTARIADLGYVAMAPELFWRMERNVDLPHDEAGMMRALDFILGFDPEMGVRDVEAALAYLRGRSEVDGAVGVMGFCFGGGLAYGAACELDPACVVAYYGVGVELLAERIDEVTRPALLHFGTEDAFITPDALARLQAAAGANPNIEIEVYDGAGHAFDNPHADADAGNAAERAWERTAAFLAANLAAR
ncbi:MAG: dienelactone hydrolase family protein [Acidimicrobiia bacterium]